MTPNPIHWLRLLKKFKTNIDGHYVLKVKDNFQVFTSNQIAGIKCYKISEINIKGELKSQYLALPVHKYNQGLHKLTQPDECKVYYDSHKKELFYFEQKLESIIESTEK
jgi:hypothetical protein